ncbi:unnamed protein product [Rhodiola kirilowii]
MRRYLLNRRSDGRILLRSEHSTNCQHQHATSSLARASTLQHGRCPTSIIREPEYPCGFSRPHRTLETDPLLEAGEDKKMDSTKMAKASSSISASGCPHAVEKRLRMARSVIKFIFMAVWICYLLIWVAKPTKVYKKSWQPVLRDYTNTIYFGVQGTGILLNMVPVFLAVVLGCVYLHLGKRLNQSRLQQRAPRNVNKEVWGSWKRPCLVKGPLGIVSWTELAFLIMFIVLLIWSFANYVHRGLDKINRVKPDDEKRSLVVLEAVGLWIGLVGNICLALLFFPVTRTSSILPLFGLTTESSVRYHIWLGHIAMFLSTAHGALFILSWIFTSDFGQMLKWDIFKVSNVAGEISLLSGILMWVTTFPSIRQKMFELFFYTHQLYIVFVVFFMLHIGINFALMMLPGFYLFVIDRYLRLLQSQQRVKLISARVLPCKTVELNFAKSPGLKYPPTSHIFVNVPSISKLQWHPFTVCSNSDLEPDNLSVMIKSEGSWSQKLYQLLSTNSSIEHLPVSVEGPYGSSSTHFLRYDTLVMVSGGSGISPFISIIRGLMHANAQKTPKVVLICAFKSSSDLTMLDLLLPPSAPSSTFSNLNIQIEAYITREQEPLKQRSYTISTVWFKPKKSDVHISPTLGPNSWLCLAIIIASSFIISLISTGFVTKYFIYPIDENTGKKYPKTFNTMIYMVSFFGSIVLSATVAFLWNKRQNAKDANQVNSMVHTPDSATGSDPDDLELESLNRTNLLKVTNVHYGARPDFRMIRTECTGSSAGVLACGPKGMLSDVASVCSSHSTDSIHFEFISFSW